VIFTRLNLISNRLTYLVHAKSTSDFIIFGSLSSSLLTIFI